MQRMTLKKQGWLVIAVGANPERIGPRFKCSKAAKSWASDPERQFRVLSVSQSSRIVYVERLDAEGLAMNACTC